MTTFDKCFPQYFVEKNVSLDPNLSSGFPLDTTLALKTFQRRTRQLIFLSVRVKEMLIALVTHTLVPVPYDPMPFPLWSGIVKQARGFGSGAPYYPSPSLRKAGAYPSNSPLKCFPPG